jgi:hypothetical protein
MQHSNLMLRSQAGIWLCSSGQVGYYCYYHMVLKCSIFCLTFFNTT